MYLLLDESTPDQHSDVLEIPSGDFVLDVLLELSLCLCMNLLGLHMRR
jgi:hypothetical protein